MLWPDRLPCVTCPANFASRPEGARLSAQQLFDWGVQAQVTGKIVRRVLTTTLMSGAAAILAISPSAAWQAASRSFAAMVTIGSGGSHILGNPDARVRLVEYVSYTCPHCAHFAEESAQTLRARYVEPGTVSVEVRHIIRDPVDLAMAVAANCGSPSRFFSRHDALMAAQAGILNRVRALPESSTQRWSSAPADQRLRRVADDSGVTEWMRTRGFTPAQIDRCLADVSMHQRIFALSRMGLEAGVAGTPSFAINGRLLTDPDVHDWGALQPALDRAIAR